MTLALAGGPVVAVGCGDAHAGLDGNPIDDLVTDATAKATTPPKDITPECPPTRPRENTACPALGSTCEFGKSADTQCNAMLSCAGATDTGASYWEPRPSDPCHERMCPAGADVASLDGKPCTIASDGGLVTDADEAVCNMTDGICACTTGRDGTTAHARQWICVRPISVCPANRPHAGQPCGGGLWCDYGSCSFKRGLLMECKNNRWQTGGAPCQ